MKYIIACLLGLGFITAQAQDGNKVQTSPPPTCSITDVDAAGCRVEDDAEKGNIQKGGSNIQDNNLNPDKENNADINKGSGSGSVKNAEDKYSEPEEESDTGILDYSQSYEGGTTYDKWKEVREGRNNKEAIDAEEVAKNISPSVKDTSTIRK